MLLQLEMVMQQLTDNPLHRILRTVGGTATSIQMIISIIVDMVAELVVHMFNQ